MIESIVPVFEWVAFALDGSTLYAAEVPGFMMLDFLSQDRVVLRVIETETGDVYVRALR